jgi:uncharacterized protein (TIGR02996 family)
MDKEWGFLNAILERPEDDTLKLIYADWLEERGDPRGEYLRWMMKVRQDRVITPEQRQRHNALSAELAELHGQELRAALSGRGFPKRNSERSRRVQELRVQLADLSKQIRQQIPPRLQELAATFDTNWLAIVSDPVIEGCGKHSVGSWPLRFEFLCDKSWADLKPTRDNTVRHCETCSKHVHFCDNLADAREHAREGHCLAVDLGIIRREGDLVPRLQFMGIPSGPDDWLTGEEYLDDVSQARLEARKPTGKGRARRR